MRLFTKAFLMVLLCMIGLPTVQAKTEKVHATFEAPSNTNTTWNAETKTFTWSTTYYNQLKDIGLPKGDITKYKKLVVDCDIKSGDQFRVLIYKGGSNLTLYASNGVNEFILADTLKVLYPNDYNEYLLACDEICLSGNNNAAPGEAVINDVYLETYDDEGEKVYATFEAPSNTNTTWNAETKTFTWSTTYYNQLKNIGLPKGDITKYKKLVVDCDIKSGDQFRVLIYKGGSNLTLYASNGVNEFILADTLKALYPNDYNEYLLACDEICLSGNNNAAPGEAVINSVYLETYPENESVEIPEIQYEEDPGKPAGEFVELTEAFTSLQPRIGIGADTHPIVLGNGEVVVGQRSKDVIADLSAYEKLTIVATPGLKLVLYMNHEVDAQQNAGDYAAADEGKYVFMDVQADENGLIEVDLTKLNKQDLNCICLPWDNSNKGTVWYLLLTPKAAAAEPLFTLKATVDGEVSVGLGVYDNFDVYSVDFGDGVLKTDSVGNQNGGIKGEDGLTKPGTTHTNTTKFTATVTAGTIIKVYGKSDLWYLNTNGGVVPDGFDQAGLAKVVQMSITGADVKSVAIPENNMLKVFSFNNSSLKNIDLTKATALTSLTINNTSSSKFEPQLESIDLSKNTELTYLSLQGNQNSYGKLTSLDLSNNKKLQGMGLYAQYNQLSELTLPAEWAADEVTETQTITYGLTMINVQNNQLTALNTANLKKMKQLYAADNQLTTIDVSGMENLAWFDVKNNKLAGDLDLTVSTKLTNVYVNNNELTSVKVSDVTKQFYVDGNKLTLATLPAQPASMNTTSKTKQFHYAPQAAIQVPELVSTLDLSAQATVAKGELNPSDWSSWLTANTTFTLLAGTDTLKAGTDYEETAPGKFRFLKDQEKKVRVEMLNEAFPKFTATAPFTTTEFTAKAPLYIETDLTAQFPVDYNGWSGATDFVGWAAPKVTTNDGRETAACERYNGDCTLLGDVFTRTLTGLTNGTYTIELYGAAAYTAGRGFDSELTEGDETAVYLYAQTPAGTVKKYIPAHVADNFNGTGIATAVLEGVEITDGTVKLGMAKDKAYTNWHVVQIKGVTAQVDAVELHYATLAAANKALAAEENAIVTGQEKTALETAIAANATVAEKTVDAYKAAIKTLEDSTAAFKAAKDAYQSLADAKALVAPYGFKYATAEKKAAAEAAAEATATNAADATEKTAAMLKAYRAYAESSALAEGVEGAKNCTDSIKNADSQDGVNGWTIVKGEGSGGNISVLEGEPFTDAADVATHKYFDGGNWGANAWDVALEQKIGLPAGKYQLSVTARAEKAVDLTLFAGTDSVKLTAISSVGGLFNRGWNDGSVEFELTKEDSVAIGVRGVTSEVHNWMSFTRFRLVKIAEFIDSVGDAKAALSEAIAAAKAVSTEGKTEASVTALNAAITAAENALAAEDATVASLTDAKTALEAAVAGLEDQPKDQIIPTDVTEPTYTYPASWNFTNWSDATVANLKADAAYSIFNGWSDVEKDPAGKDKSGNPNPQEPTEASKDNCFWHQGKTDAYGQLYAAGKLIEETKGLKFNEAYAATRGLAIAVNYPSTSLGTYAGGQYLWLGGGGKNVPCFVLPQVPAGMQITVVVESHKPAEARGIELYAGSIDAANKIGDSFKPTTQDTHTWDIETAGDIVVYNTSGCHIYSINVTQNTTGIKSIAADGLNGTLYNMNGQKVLKAQKGLFIINGKKVVKK